MTSNINIIFSSLRLTEKLATYLKLTEDLDAKIDKLIGSKLQAGYMILDQISTSETQTESLLQQARSKFYDAVQLEKNERLMCAYIGLALCHDMLGEKKNRNDTLKRIIDFECDKMTDIRQNIAIIGTTVAVALPLSWIGAVDLALNKTGISENFGMFDKTVKFLDRHIPFPTPFSARLAKLKQSVREYLSNNS